MKRRSPNANMYQRLPFRGQVAGLVVVVVVGELGPAAESVDVVDEVAAQSIGQVDEVPLALLVPRALDRGDVFVENGGPRGL